MRINLGWLYTETSQNQITVLAMIMIFIAWITCIIVGRNSTIDIACSTFIAGLGGYQLHKYREKRRKK